MPKYSRDVLKAFFQTGSNPGSAHFGSLIDSFVHSTEDRALLGLKNHNPSVSYLPGDTVIFNSSIYQAIVPNTGTFAAENWHIVSSANAALPVSPGSQTQSTHSSVFGSDYLIAESAGESFMSSDEAPVSKVTLSTGKRSGVFRMQWSLVAHHQQSGGFGRFQLMNSSSSQLVGKSLVYRQNDPDERIVIGDFVLVDLNGTSQTLDLQYQTLTNGMKQYVEGAKVELFKIADFG